MTSERRTAVVVVLMLLGAGGVGVAAGALMGRSDRTSGASAQAASGADAGSSAPTTPTGPTAAPTPGGRVVPVYVLGPTAAGPRLYREFRPSAGADPVEGAVAGLAVAPRDPDYRSAWLGVPGRVSRAGSTATVTFGRQPALAGTNGQLAAQQVVYTVTAADPRIRAVRVVAPGLAAGGAAGRAAHPRCWRRSGCSTRSTAARPAPG
jgi:hypothetical protein